MLGVCKDSWRPLRIPGDPQDLAYLFEILFVVCVPELWIVGRGQLKGSFLECLYEFVGRYLGESLHGVFHNIDQLSSSILPASSSKSIHVYLNLLEYIPVI